MSLDHSLMVCPTVRSARLLGDDADVEAADGFESLKAVIPCAARVARQRWLAEPEKRTFMAHSASASTRVTPFDRMIAAAPRMMP